MTRRNGSEGSGSRKSLHVLIVDDSAVVREVITALLSQEPGISVAAASDPLIAMEKMRVHRPDVIVLDLQMPRMDGLTFLKKIMSEDPMPVVICSSLTTVGAGEAVEALENGAVGIITKPQVGVEEFLHESETLLLDAVRGASQARLQRIPSKMTVNPRLSPDVIIPKKEVKSRADSHGRFVAIGASTGGTEALRVVIERLPADSPGIVVVQHMPGGFTKAFAKRLNELCEMEVKEAEEGDWVRPGRVIIAPGNRHMTVVRKGLNYVVKLNNGSLVNRHRPSVDVLFHSVAQAAGPNAVGVILTGMGMDGAGALLEMRKAGAHTIAQDEESCVVYGMPKAAIELGAAEGVVSLIGMHEAILKFALGQDQKALEVMQKHQWSSDNKGAV